jgi:hypothetical protein
VLAYELFFCQYEIVEFEVLFSKYEKLDQMTYLPNMFKLLNKLNVSARIPFKYHHFI